MCGILNNEKGRKLFSRVFAGKRCAACRAARNSSKDMRNGRYSQVLPGFSSPIFHLPIDVMIISQGHGGGDGQSSFPVVGTLDEETIKFYEYYYSQPMKRVNQFLMRRLLRALNRKKLAYVFTDYEKCYVDSNSDPDVAVRYCGRYLLEQIATLRPKTIIAMGKNVAGFLKIKVPAGCHGGRFSYHGIPVIYSMMPTQWNSDRWVEKAGWKPILKQI